MYSPPKPKMYEHRATLKKNLEEYLTRSGFDELRKDWIIQTPQPTRIKDRITQLQDNPENKFEPIDVTPFHETPAILFKLRAVNHHNFDFLIYDDYEKPELVYFKPAVYYYGNYIKDNVFGLVTLGRVAASFKAYCQEREALGDHHAMHNYKIDMETVEKHNLMR